MPEHDMRPENPFATREEGTVPCFNMRQGLTPPLNLDSNPEILGATGEEP